MPKPDDLLDALIDKLGEISPVWSETFPPNPSGYKKLQRLINKYGSGNVRNALQIALERRIVPQGASAMSLMVGLLNAYSKVEDVKVKDAL